MKKILIVEDDPVLLNTYSAALKSLGYEVEHASDLKDLKKKSRKKYTLVLMNRSFKGAILDEMLVDGKLKFRSPVIMVSGITDAEKAARLIENGVIVDFIHKAEGTLELTSEIRRIERKLKDVRPDLMEFYNGIFDLPHKSRRLVKRKIIAYSPVMVDVIRRAIAYARSPGLNILIVGEAGTGRSALADYVVEHIPGKKSLIKVPPGQWNILSEVEEERVRVGYEQEGDENFVVVLDGIEELPRGEQVYILGLVKESRARFVSVATLDIFDRLKSRDFIPELFQYLSGGLLMIPPLRKRMKEEIALLLEHFLRKEEKARRIKVGLSEEAFRILISYPWPGNVVELELKVKSAVATLSPGNRIIGVNNIPGEIVQFVKSGNESLFQTFLANFLTSLDYESVSYEEIENWTDTFKYALLKKIFEMARFDLKEVKKILKTERPIEKDPVVRKILEEAGRQRS